MARRNELAEIALMFNLAPIRLKPAPVNVVVKNCAEQKPSPATRNK
jgi:hypothetical protein